MASRTRINPLSVLFVIAILAYGLFTINRHASSTRTTQTSSEGGAADPPSAGVETTSDPENPTRLRWPTLPGFGSSRSNEPRQFENDANVANPATRTSDDGSLTNREQQTIDSENRLEIERGQLVSGRVVKIVDGDTIDLLLNDQRTIRIRLDGIDAPERGQAFWRESRQHLGTLCHGQPVFAMILDKDRYGRLIGDVYQQNVWVNGEMVKAGLAWHYKKYNESPELASLERSAQEFREGLWSDPAAMAPWDYRGRSRGQNAQQGQVTQPVGRQRSDQSSSPVSSPSSSIDRSGLWQDQSDQPVPREANRGDAIGLN